MRNLPVSFTEYLLRLQSNPWKVQHVYINTKECLVRETTPKICFVIYFAEISNYFQMYNSNSNAESKIRKKKIINNKSLKKKPYIIRCIVKVLVRHFRKLIIIIKITLNNILLFAISTNNNSYFDFAISRNLAFFQIQVKMIKIHKLIWTCKYILPYIFTVTYYTYMYIFQNICQFNAY